MKAKKTTALALGTMIVVSNGIPVFAKSNTSSVLVANVSNDMIEKTIDNVSNLILDNINAIEINETKPQEEVSYTYVQQEPVYVYTVEETVSEPVNMSVEEFLSIFDVEEPAVVDTSIEQAAYEQALANYNEALAAYEAASQVVETTKEVEVEVTEETIDDEGNVIETTYTEIQTVTETSTAGDVDTAKANLDVAKTVLEEARFVMEAASVSPHNAEQTISEEETQQEKIIAEVSEDVEKSVVSGTKTQTGMHYSDMFYMYDSDYLVIQEYKHNIKDTLDALTTAFNDYCDSSDFQWTEIREGIKTATDLESLWSLIQGDYEDTQFSEVLSSINLTIFRDFNSFSKTTEDANIEITKLVNGLKSVADAMDAYEEYLSGFTIEEIDGDFGNKVFRLYDMMEGKSYVYGPYAQKLMVLSERSKDEFFSEMSGKLETIQTITDLAKTIYVGMIIESIRADLIQSIIDASDPDSTLHQGMTSLMEDIEEQFDEYFLMNFVKDEVAEKACDLISAILIDWNIMSVVQAALNVIDTVVFDFFMEVPTLTELLEVKAYYEYIDELDNIFKAKASHFDETFKTIEIEEFEDLYNLIASISKTALTEAEGDCEQQ